MNKIFWTLGLVTATVLTVGGCPAPSGSPANVVALGVDNETISEDGGSAVVTATLGAAVDIDVTLTLGFEGTAVAGVDYTASADTITIPAGETTGGITLTGESNQVQEGDRTIVVSITEVNGGRLLDVQPVTVTLVDNDSTPAVTLTVPGADPQTTTIAEGGGQVTVVATLTQIATVDVTVGLAFGGTATQADYTASADQIVIPAGQIAGSIVVTAVDDSVFENVQTIVIDIDSVSEGATEYTADGQQQVTIMIEDDDPAPLVSLSVDSASIAEDGGLATVTVSLSEASEAVTTVHLDLTGTALIGIDYTAGARPVQIPAGQTSATFTITATSDDLHEQDETVIVDVADVTNGTEDGDQKVVVTIVNADPQPSVTLTASGSPINENGGVATVTATLSNPSWQDVVVSLSFAGVAEPGIDYEVSARQIVIPTGSLSGMVTLTGVDDSLSEADESVVVTIDSIDNGVSDGNQEVIVTIVDDDPQPTVDLQISGSSLAENGGEATLTATLSTVAGQDVTVLLAYSGAATRDVDYEAPSQIVIPAGSSSADATLTVLDDQVAEGDEDVVIEIAGAIGAEAGSQQAVTATILDDDTLGVAVVQSGGATAVKEGAETDTLSVVLNSQPTADVTVTLTPDEQLEIDGGGAGAAAVLTFTAANWNTPRTVTVAAIDDDDQEGPHQGTVAFSVASADAAYDGYAIATITVDIADNDTPGVTIAEPDGGIFVHEGGESATYTLVLDSEPAAQVEIIVDPDDQVDLGAGGDMPVTLTFTPANWNIPQTVTVTAVDDAVAEGANPGTITHAVVSADTNYGGIAVGNVTVAIGDNDFAGINVSEGDGVEVSEDGVTDTYTVVLNSQPIADVDVEAAPDADLDLGAGPGTPVVLTFTPANWNVAQTVTVAAVDDAVAEGLHVGRVTHVASSLDPRYDGRTGNVDVTANITDNDSAGVVILQSDGFTSVTEGGTDDSYDIVLTSAPTADVTVTVAPDSQLDVGNGPAGAIVLTFTSANWDIAQTVTVSAVDDAWAEASRHPGGIAHTLVSDDPVYDGLAVATLNIAIVDNDQAGVAVVESGHTIVAEGGAGDSYTLVLTVAPTADVVVTVQPDDQVEVGAGPGVPVELTFTPANWDQPQVVNVVAVDDPVAEGLHYGTITHTVVSNDTRYDGIAVADVTAEVGDNDHAGVIVTEDPPLVIAEGGPGATYTIMLESKPIAPVTIVTVPDDQVDIGAGVGVTRHIVIQPDDWNIPVVVMVVAADDDVAEGTHVGVITHTATSDDRRYEGKMGFDATATIIDND